MTGLTPDDIALLILGMILTRTAKGEPAALPPGGQEERIVAVLRDESDTRMLLDVARADIEILRREMEKLLTISRAWPGVAAEISDQFGPHHPL